MIIALSGSFDILITNRDGSKNYYTLNRSYCGLYLPPNTWRQMLNFSTNSISLHLSSEKYNEDDYIREFEVFKHGKSNGF